jgi:hypothetical protein
MVLRPFVMNRFLPGSQHSASVWCPISVFPSLLPRMAKRQFILKRWTLSDAYHCLRFNGLVSHESVHKVARAVFEPVCERDFGHILPFRPTLPQAITPSFTTSLISGPFLTLLLCLSAHFLLLPLGLVPLQEYRLLPSLHPLCPLVQPAQLKRR